LVDTLGLSVAVVVTAANVEDRQGLIALLTSYFADGVTRLRKLWVDGGYRAEWLHAWVWSLKRTHKMDLEVVEHTGKGFARGQSLRQIAAACGLDTKTVRAWGRSETLPLDQRGYRGAGKIDAYIPYLRTRLAEGCTNQSRLWREIRAQGFTGIRSLVAKWVHTHGQSQAGPPPPAPPRLPAAHQLTWLLLQAAEQRTADEQALWECLQQHAELREVAALVCQGTTMIRQRQAVELDAWLQACRASTSVELQNCAEWLQRDYAAVHAALRFPWSTGPVEGQINRLKLIKRSGYGRMKLDLLRQRVLYNAA
jgi:transposase